MTIFTKLGSGTSDAQHHPYLPPHILQVTVQHGGGGNDWSTVGTRKHFVSCDRRNQVHTASSTRRSLVSGRNRPIPRFRFRLELQLALHCADVLGESTSPPTI